MIKALKIPPVIRSKITKALKRAIKNMKTEIKIDIFFGKSNFNPRKILIVNSKIKITICKIVSGSILKRKRRVETLASKKSINPLLSDIPYLLKIFFISL